MAKDARYALKFKRRRLGITDYRKRIKLLKSGLPRLVVRVTNKYIIAHITEFGEKGDITHIFLTSKKLKDFGWKLPSFKNVPAAYLTGYLIGKLCLKKGIKKVVLDIGRKKAVRGSRVFAVLKGAVDAGLEVPHSEEIFPDDERIRGEHIKSYYESKNFGSSFQFNKYKELKIDPDFIIKNIEEVRENIDKNA